MPNTSEEIKYPVFREPDEYMAMRHRPTLGGWLKQNFERRTLDRCFEGLDDVRTVCDVPTGPGRLFPYWHGRSLRVHGFDFSPEMAEAAARLHGELGLEGRVAQGNAFELPDLGDDRPDMIASVRFIYYFEPERRVALLRSLAAASRRYVLVQYKTTETLKGHINATRDFEKKKKGRLEHMAKVGCSNHEILRELTEAGLVPLRIEPIGEFSDRCYVLAEKVGLGVESTPTEVAIRRSAPLTGLATAIACLLVVLVPVLSGHGYWSEHEALWALGARSTLLGNFLLPELYAGVHATLPPLLFWWLAAIGGLFGGVSDTTVHFGSALIAAGTLASVFAFARRCGGREVAILSAVVLGTSYEFWSHLGMASNEALLALLTTVGWGAGYLLVEGEKKKRLWFAMWGSVGLAGLSGGVFGLLVAGALPLAWAAVRRRVRAVHSVGGVALALAPVAAWAILTGFAHGSATVTQVLFGEMSAVVRRAMGPSDSIARILLEFPLNLLPWSVVAVLLGFEAVARRHEPYRELPPWVWYAIAAVGLTLVAVPFQPAREEAYLMIAAPWASLLMGKAIWRRATAIDASSTTSSTEVRQVGGRRFWGRVLGLRAGRFAAAAAIASLLLFLSYSGVAQRSMDDERSARQAAEAIADAVDPNDTLVVFGEPDLRLLPYLREAARVIPRNDGGRAELDALIRSGRDVDVVAPAAELDWLRSVAGRRVDTESAIRHPGGEYVIVSME